MYHTINCQDFVARLPTDWSNKDCNIRVILNRYKIHLTRTQYCHNAVSWLSSPDIARIHQRIGHRIYQRHEARVIHLEGEEKGRKREEENDYSIEECSIKRTKRLRRCRYRIISFHAMIRKNLLEESHFEGKGGTVGGLVILATIHQ